MNITLCPCSALGVVSKLDHNAAMIGVKPSKPTYQLAPGLTPPNL